jgi:hypothetical protein
MHPFASNIIGSVQFSSRISINHWLSFACGYYSFVFVVTLSVYTKENTQGKGKGVFTLLSTIIQAYQPIMSISLSLTLTQIKISCG